MRQASQHDEFDGQDDDEETVESPTRPTETAGRSLPRCPTPEGADDAAGWALVLARYKSGDRDAFNLLMRDQLPGLQRVTQGMQMAENDAEDLLNETLLAVWNKRSAFEGDLKGFRAWTRKILVYEVLELRRQYATRQEDESPEDDDLAAPQTDDALTALEEANERELLEKAIEQLPESQRRVVRLRLKGHEFEAIAETCAKIERKPVTAAAVTERYRVAVERLCAACAPRSR